ncbi:MAG: sulfite exporter TauE/SafE family protein [Balneolales bacterium]
MITLFAILILVGILAGILAGLFGLGGGILFTPAIYFLYQSEGIPDPVLWTIGTSLLCNSIAALSSTYKHYQMDNLFLREGILTGIFGILGTYAGRIVATSPFYSDREFTVFFSIILFYSAIHHLRKNKPSELHTGKTVRPMKLYHALLIGFSAGMLAMLGGVGGGIIMVPAMTIVLSFSFKKVVSISSLAITLITFSGWIQLANMEPATGGISGIHWGYLDLATAFPLILGSTFGARYGVYLANVIRLRTLEILFGLFVLMVTGRLLYGLI